MKIKTALIGFGYSANTIHLPLITSDPAFELVSVVSSQVEKVKQDLPEVACYADLDAMLAASDAALVVITAPNDVHFALAKQCIEAGRHVLLEKPFVVSVGEGETLIALAEKHKVVLSVFHNRRWDGDFITVAELIKTQRLGKIRVFSSHFDRLRPVVRPRWREQAGQGTGIWYDLGPHLVDQALCLFGPPMGISAHCRNLRPGSAATDYFHVQLHYPTLEVILQSSPYCFGDTLRFDVQGESGRYIKYALDKQEHALQSGIHPAHEQWLAAIKEPPGKFISESGESVAPTLNGRYDKFYALLALAITEGTEPPVSAQDALAAIAIIERVHQQCGLAWV